MENEMDTLTTDEKMLIMLLRTEKINTQRAISGTRVVRRRTVLS